jgi:hypothetical protein
LNILKENKMTIKGLSLFLIVIFSICIVQCISNKKKTHISDNKGVIERWHRIGDTIFYSQVDINRNDTVVFKQEFGISKVDSFFIFQDRKIYLFEDRNKLPKFDSMAKYFDDNLPTIGFDIEITLWMAAIITKSGHVEHIGIIQNPSNRSYILPTIDVVKKMPHWSPAHIGDENVASLVMFPVHHKVK